MKGCLPTQALAQHCNAKPLIVLKELIVQRGRDKQADSSSNGKERKCSKKGDKISRDRGHTYIYG